MFRNFTHRKKPFLEKVIVSIYSVISGKAVTSERLCVKIINSRATHNIKQRQVKKGTSWYIIVDQVIIFCKLECMPHYTDNNEAKIIGRNNKRNYSTSIQICIYEKIITYLINIEWGISIKKNNE